MSRFLGSAFLTAIPFLMLSTPGRAVTINFETLPDSYDVGSFYHASYGVDFQSAISLTAGYSLDQIDFPPHSGIMVVGDNVANDGDPMVLTFVNPVNHISAYFAYGSQLTFSAYNSNNILIETYVTPVDFYLGADQFISLSASGVSRLDIAGATADSFIMDDLSFTQNMPANIPDGGATITMVGIGMVFLLLMRERT